MHPLNSPRCALVLALCLCFSSQPQAAEKKTDIFGALASRGPVKAALEQIRRENERTLAEQIAISEIPAPSRQEQVRKPPRAVAASTDANVPMRLGIPAITASGGGVADKAHSLGEWYEPVDAWWAPQCLLLTTLGLVGLEGGAKPTLAP